MNDEYQAKKKRNYALGTILLMAGPLVMILVLGGISQDSFSPYVILLPLAFLVPCVGTGAAAFALATQDDIYLRTIGFLQRIHPSPLITEDFAVAEVVDVIVFVLKKSEGSLFFTCIDTLNALATNRIRVPGFIPRWGRTKIADYSVHRLQGRYSVPTPNGDIVTCDCVLYVLPMLGRSYIVRVPSFSRERLLQLVHEIANAEAQKCGGGLSSL